MIDLAAYEEALTALKLVIKNEKAREKVSKQFHSLDWHNTTTKRRAAVSDRLTDACHSVDRAKDVLHARLVDAGLAPLKPLDHYLPYTIGQSAGFGHSIKFNYRPALPKSIKAEIDPDKLL